MDVIILNAYLLTQTDTVTGETEEGWEVCEESQSKDSEEDA